MILLEVRHLSKHFVRREGLFGPATLVHAVDDVSFAIEEGETFGLVGESGSGKTTIGRSIVRLVEPTSGEVLFRGENLLSLDGERLRRMRRQIQIVFQDPYTSLNPRMRVGAIVAEPLEVHGIGTRATRAAKVSELLAMVGLDPDMASRHPHEFSGGQRQRIGLARALALEPSLIVADEPVSSLDVSVQAQIVNLLLDLQSRLGLTYLFIAHDLRLVEHVCHRLGVMYRGRIVEMGATAAVFATPAHPYTRALLSAVPAFAPGASPPRIVLDPDTVRRDAPLRAVADGHWAAI